MVEYTRSMPTRFDTENKVIEDISKIFYVWIKSNFEMCFNWICRSNVWYDLRNCKSASTFDHFKNGKGHLNGVKVYRLQQLQAFLLQTLLTSNKVNYSIIWMIQFVYFPMCTAAWYRADWPMISAVVKQSSHIHCPEWWSEQHKNTNKYIIA